jgi:ribosomal protein S18 acetylase RimI-like enzyme
MTPILSVNQALDAIQQAKAGATAYCTNFFPTPAKLQAWVDHRELFGEIKGKSSFLFRKDRDFYRFHFSAPSGQNLRDDLSAVPELKTERLVADLVGNEASVSELLALLQSAGFRPYRRLNRLIRSAQPGAAAAPNGSSQIVCAELNDRDAILKLLNSSFNHYADQIPTDYEIEAAISARQILAIKCDGALAAMLFFETQGFTSTVRYWVVSDKFQSRGFGSALMRHYFTLQSAVRRFILWVTIDNENALQKYRHYGYSPDGLVDHVLVNSLIPE